MTKLFADTQPQAESGQRLGLFYQHSGFIPYDGQPDMFAGIKATFEPPRPADPGNAEAVLACRQFDWLREAFRRAIVGVSGANVQLRFAVSPSSRPFKKLQKEPSIKEYSLMMARAVWMIKTLVQESVASVTAETASAVPVETTIAVPVETVVPVSTETEIPLPVETVAPIPAGTANPFPIDEDLAELVRILFGEGGLQDHQLWSVLGWIFAQDTHLALPTDLLSLFVKFWATKSKPNYLPATDVERLLAKVTLH